MSIKLFNGYCLPKMSLDDLYDFLIPFGKKARSMACKIAKRQTAFDAIRLLDGHVLFEKGIVKNKIFIDESVLNSSESKSELISPIMYARNIMTKAHQDLDKTFAYRNPLYDFSLSISILKGNDKLLAILFCEQKDLEDLWLKQKEVSPYPYWDNTDPPEDLTEKEWEERGKEWDSSLQEGTPSYGGLTFEPVANWRTSVLDINDLHKFFPTINKRAINWTEDELFRFYMNKEGGMNEKSIGNLFTGYKKWRKEEEGKKLFEELKKEIKEKLPKISVEILKEDIPIKIKK